MAHANLDLVILLLPGPPPQCCDSRHAGFIKLLFIVLVSSLGAD